MRLRHMVRIAPSPSEITNLRLDDDVTFAPMETLADGLGGLDAPIAKPLGDILRGNYNYFAEGDVLLAKVTPCFENGKKAIARSLLNGVGFATSEVHVIRPLLGKVDTDFLRYLFSSSDFVAAGIRNMTGASGLRRVSEKGILNYRPRVTDLHRQKSIADFLDRETSLIDRLIEKKHRFVDLAAKRVDGLVDKAISDPMVSWVRFENAVRRVHRPVVLSDHDTLIRLGLYNRGRGIFRKPAADEEGMGASDFFFVKAGDLILSGQFAWEGAVALATENEDGCVVSHRYPIYRGKEGVSTAYLLGLLRSNHGDFILNESSQGSAGRNRPLNTWRIGKEKIPIPDVRLQGEVECALTFERRVKKKVAKTIALLREFRAALITAAVTGQIDITNSDLPGQVDRRLGEIEGTQP